MAERAEAVELVGLLVAVQIANEQVLERMGQILDVVRIVEAVEVRVDAEPLLLEDEVVHLQIKLGHGEEVHRRHVQSLGDECQISSRGPRWSR